jgi:hypothetical protein
MTEHVDGTTLDLIGIVDGATLRAAIDPAVTIASTDPNLPALNCVRIATDAAGLTLDASDQYRMVHTTVPRTHHPEAPHLDNVVHTRCLAYVARTLADGPVQIGIGPVGPDAEVHLVFLSSSTTVGIRTMANRTARGGDIFSTALLRVARTHVHTRTITADTAEFAAAVHRAAGAPLVRLDVDADGLTLHTSSGTGTVPAAVVGDPISLRFTPRRLLDALTTCPGAVVHLAIAHERTFITVRPAADGGRPDDTHTHILMPAPQKA